MKLVNLIDTPGCLQNNIDSVRKNERCCSCGICAGICHQNAISMEIVQTTRELLPHVHADRCTECGNCLKTCPGLADAEKILVEDWTEYKQKQCTHLSAYLGHILDTDLLKHCASGGIVSELIRTLLTNKTYESAFLVHTKQYSCVVKSEHTKDFSYSSCKSRYIAVSHENAVRYMLNHRDEKIIIVATGCAVNGFRKVIEQYQLNTDNYLFIGLFCEKILTYGIWDYFDNEYAQYGSLKGMDFKNKRKSGWPGDMLLYFDNTQLDVNRKIRMNTKRFFQNRRCLYCANKLNESADIAVGDNYTGKNAPKSGSSSIIVRTDAGGQALDKIREKCMLTPISVNEIYNSQKLDKRQRNISNAKLKYQGIIKSGALGKDAIFYCREMLAIKIGETYYKSPFVLRIIIGAISALKNKR